MFSFIKIVRSLKISGTSLFFLLLQLICPLIHQSLEIVRIFLHHRYHVVENVWFPEKKHVGSLQLVLSPLHLHQFGGNTYMPFRRGRNLVRIALKSGRAVGSSAQHSVQLSRTQSKLPVNASNGGLEIIKILNTYISLIFL